MLEKLKGKFGHQPSIPPEKIPPTIGMNLARLHHQGSKLVIWDLSGQFKMRMLWEKYYDDAHCIIFLVDAHDRDRLDEAKLAFGTFHFTLTTLIKVILFNFLVPFFSIEAVCDNDLVRNTPIIILANKQDLPVSIFKFRTMIRRAVINTMSIGSFKSR